MPNWVKTVVKIKNVKPAEMNYILEMVADNVNKEGESPSYCINFDKLIPEPRTIEECDEDCIRTEDSHVCEESDRPWFNWYDWHCKHWDTKWNATEGYHMTGKSYIILVFETAWSLAEQPISMLSLLGHDIDLKYADEDLGVNCGKAYYRVNSGRWEWDLDLKDPMRFAKNLWDNY